MSQQMKRFVLITGMHRSGTSFLARAMNLSGVHLGEINSFISNDWITLSDNLRGHWENKEILELTKKTFSYNKGSWDEPPKSIRVNSKLGKKIKKCIDSLTKTSSLAAGFKDPRIIFLFESWQKYLPKNFVIIGIFRNPLKVAESLKIRDGFNYEKSLHSWEIYNEKLLSLLEKHNGFLLDFDWPKQKLFSETKLIFRKLGLDENIDLSSWYTKKLFHSDKTYNSKYHMEPEIKKLYTKLKQRSKKNSSVRIKKTVLNKKESWKMIHELLSEGQQQGNYFKKLYDSQDKIIKQKDTWMKQKNNEFSKLKVETQNKIKEKDSELTKLEEEIELLVKEGKAELTKLKAEYEKTISQKDSELTKLKAEYEKTISQKDSELTKLKDEEERIRNTLTKAIEHF